MRFSNDVIWTDVSLGATVNSNPIPVESIVYMDVSATWTGASADGTLKLQVSNDDPTSGDDLAPTITNWYDAISNGSITPSAAVTVSGAGSARWEVKEFGFKWVRLVFTRTSGTGTINARFNAKGF